MPAKNNKAYSFIKDLLSLITVMVCLLAMVGCAPFTNKDDACPLTDVTVTGLKDKGKVDKYHKGIDEPMSTLMGSSGAKACAVAVVTDNQLRTINGYGNTPFASGVIASDINTPWVAQTRFYIGSISKTVTALAMLKLAEQRSDVNIDQPLKELFPTVNETPEWANFTIRKYLAHGTGVRENPSSSNLNDEAVFNDLITQADPHPGIYPRYAYYAYKGDAGPIEPFPQQFTARYSNIGYALVGAAIDYQTAVNTTGDPIGYERYVYENIAKNNGSVNVEPTMLSMCLGTKWRAPNMVNLAQGWSKDGDMLPPPQYSGWEGPPGGWTMTIGDLGRLMIAINSNARISQTTRDNDMLSSNNKETPYHDDISMPFYWGLGVYRGIALDGFIYGKGGDATGYGFTSDFIMYRDQGAGAAIICNQDGTRHSLLHNVIKSIIQPCLTTSATDKPAYCDGSPEVAERKTQ